MDIVCPRCGEPWDLDTLHDEVDARFPAQDGSRPAGSGSAGRHEQAAYEALFRQVREDFAARGCEAIASYDGRCRLEGIDTATARRSAQLISLLGDDIDAIAAMTEDLTFLSDGDDRENDAPPREPGSGPALTRTLPPLHDRGGLDA